MGKKVYEEENIRAIADKIREKTGGDATYKTSQMPEGVESVYEAGQKAEYDRFWDNFQQNGNRIDYSGAFYGRGWNAETFKPKYKPMKPTSNYADRMFFGFSAKVTEAKTSITPEIVDFSQCRLMENTFKDSTFDTVIADLSNAESLNSTFNMGNGTSYGIRSITLKVTEKCTSFNVAFAYAYNMEELFFTEDSIISANLSVKESNKLTHESLMSIINALKDYSNKTMLRFSDTEYTVSGYNTDPRGVAFDVHYAEIVDGSLECECSIDGMYGIKITVYDVDISEADLPYISNVEFDVISIDSDDVPTVDVVITVDKTVMSKTLTIGSANIAKLTEAEKKKVTAKGWWLK